jgi:hypothetical protein
MKSDHNPCLSCRHFADTCIFLQIEPIVSGNLPPKFYSSTCLPLQVTHITQKKTMFLLFLKMICTQSDQNAQ